MIKLFFTECGVSYSTPNLKIVGGVTAVANSWPSIAYIRFNYKATTYLPGSGYGNIYYYTLHYYTYTYYGSNSNIYL